MDLLQEYKELYYKEIEFGDRLNNKIATCITFLTIIGSALILMWSQFKNYELLWYTGVYLVFCLISTAMFCISIGMFFKTYSGYKTQLFPIKSIAIQNNTVLNSIDESQIEQADKLLAMTMAERFINDAIHNRALNVQKNDRHRNLIKMLTATFVVTFISFAINVSIDYYEDRNNVTTPTQIYIQGGEINVGK